MAERDPDLFAAEYRAVATRLERLSPQLPPDERKQFEETVRLLRDHADRIGTTVEDDLPLMQFPAE